MSFNRRLKPNLGQPEYKPTIHEREKVMNLVLAGYTQDEIAEYYDCDVRTIRKHFENELDKTMRHRGSRVANKLYKVAMSGDVKALELYLKCKLQWHNYKPPEKDDKLDQVTSLLQTLVDQNKNKTE